METTRKRMVGSVRAGADPQLMPSAGAPHTALPQQEQANAAKPHRPPSAAQVWDLPPAAAAVAVAAPLASRPQLPLPGRAPVVDKLHISPGRADHGFSAQGAHEHRVSVLAARAPPVLQAVDFGAAVAAEGQEIQLMAVGVGAVPPYAQQVCIHRAAGYRWEMAERR